MKRKLKPTFDRAGYPAEETLEIIKQWDMNPSTMKDLMAFIASAWHWDDMARETSPGLWVFATGGWSGNESLPSIAVMPLPLGMGRMSNRK